MLLMIKKELEVECHAIHWYTTANNKNMKYPIKNNDLSYLIHWDAKNL